MKTQALILWAIIPALCTCSQAQEQETKTHPWASFKAGSWADVHTSHRMVMQDSTGQEQVSDWTSDDRMIVHAVHGDSVIVRQVNENIGIDEKATLIVPAIDEFPGTRAHGQWPHDIFPMGPARTAGVTVKDKNPVPQNVDVKIVEKDVELSLNGKQYKTTLYSKEWDVPAKDGKRHFTMNAWVAEGIELPLKWTLTTPDGRDDSETILVNLQETVKVGEKEIPCLVTVTKVKTRMGGELVKKRWSSTQMPGFMVKMETQMEAQGFSMQINENVTKFSIEQTGEKK